MGIADLLGGFGGASLGGTSALPFGLAGKEFGLNSGGALGKLLGMPDIFEPSRQTTPGINPEAQQSSTAPATHWEIGKEFDGIASDGKPVSRPFHSTIPGPARLAMDGANPAKEDSGFSKFLGKLGDALLVGSGAQPIYAPRQERKRLGNAVAAFLGGDEAFANLARISPEFALEARSSQQDHLDGNLELGGKARDQAYQHLGGAYDQTSYDRARGALANMLSPYGIDIAQLGLPQTFSEEALAELRNRGAKPKDQLAEARHSRRLDWDIEDDRIDNDRMQENTRSLIDTRDRRAEEYERHNRQGESNQRRGQDMTDRRARARGSGKKPSTKLPIVASPEEAMKLPSGTRFRVGSANGPVKVRP